ncbi:MAG: hypothetical protein QOG21_2058 [Actinomycetota bacterium]|jgi:hypothetical protein|nr:hypothetical protein [Actinomycetota bacterium]
MLTGNFTRELTEQRVSQLGADVAAHRATQRAVRGRRRTEQLSKAGVIFYRLVTRAVALSLLLVVGVATAAHAMPLGQQAVTKAAKSAQPAVHLTRLAGTGSSGDAWLGFAAIVTVVVLLTAMSTRRRRATA